MGADLDRVAVNGLPLLYETGTEPAVAAGFVVLVPQLPDTTNSPPRLRLWMDEVLPRYGVDRDRLYLTGLSQGGFGVFDYLEDFGDINEFAGDGADRRRLRPGDPVRGLAEHTAVGVPWRSRSQGQRDGFDQNCRFGERQLRADRTDAGHPTYPGVGHNSWDLTYGLTGMAPGPTNPVRDPYDVDIFSWMLAHVRSRTR
jgi:hypothetical protein